MLKDGGFKLANFFTCCLNCTQETGRAVGCHATCTSYIESKQAHEERKERIRKVKAKENIRYSSYSYD